MQHARGLEELLRLKGPESMQSLGTLVVLESSRPSMIFAAIFSCQRTILTFNEWKTIPWAKYPERRDAMQLLIDILADCPELFVLRNGSASHLYGTDHHLSSLQLLKALAFKVLDDLDSWREANPLLLDKWTEAPAPVDTPIHVGPDGQQCLSWKSVFHYESLQLANYTSLYYSILILSAHLILSRAGDDEYRELKANMDTAGMIICRSIDYHLDSVRVGADSLFIFFPMRMAFDAVGKKHPEIGAWLKHKLDGIPSRSSGRWATAKYLLNMQSSTTGVG